MTTRTINVKSEKELIEKLAELEHQQWEHWSKSVMHYLLKGIETYPELIAENVALKNKSWKKFWKPYSELPAAIKEMDRVWARKVIKIIKQ